MGYAELIAKLQRLPADKQAEVFDFVEFLSARMQAGATQPLVAAEWSDAEFAALAMQQALRGMEDEPVTYSRDDLREVWR